ncbi:hypothetical protein CAEBREN_01657 [Caenorhabditis brenneri]|uniref:Uncharacterized protein n=1 Tax=Caenorhabditis brenneri TaxID=135651 RepID=G0MBD8_CAEBE|nr:hypothetical protein CAEBREN_01657 [Caenorhabditis brenneri]
MTETRCSALIILISEAHKYEFAFLFFSETSSTEVESAQREASSVISLHYCVDFYTRLIRVSGRDSET